MTHRRLLPAAALNGTLALFLALWVWWPNALLLSAAIAALVLAVPGLAWLRLFGRLVVDRASAVLVTVGLSAGLGVFALVAQMVLGIEATAGTHAAALAILTNLGLALTWGRPWPAWGRPRGALSWWVLAPAAAGVYVALFLGATRFVPGVHDHDEEVQGTAYSLVSNGTPMMLHDRRMAWHFPHPHLLHWLSAEGILLAGDIQAVRPYYDAAVVAERWLNTPIRPGDSFPAYRAEGDPPRAMHPVTVHVRAVEGNAIILDQPIRVRRADGTGATTDRPTRDQLLDRALLRAYQRLMTATFDRAPLLWQTRAVSLGLVLVVLLLLHDCAAAVSGSRLAAVLVPVAYLSVPDAAGRSCSAAYFTITMAFLVASAWWYLGPVRREDGGTRAPWPWWTSFLATALLAMANHKAVVAVGAMVVGGVLAEWFHGRWRKGLRAGLTTPVGWGFLAGTAAFWAYGLLVAPAAFIKDHVQYHLLDRLTHADPLLYVRGGAYVGVGELWRRFVVDAGVALPATAVAAAVYLVWRGAGRSRRLLVLAAWLVAVAVAFSLVDWSQTRHVMHLMPVLVLLPAVAAGVRRPGAVGAGRGSPLAPLIWCALLAVSCLTALWLTVDWIRNGYASFIPAGGW